MFLIAWKKYVDEFGTALAHYVYKHLNLYSSSASIIRHWSNDWSWIRAGIIQKSEKNSSLFMKVWPTSIQNFCMLECEMYCMSATSKNAHKLLDNLIHNGNLRVLQYYNQIPANCWSFSWFCSWFLDGF